MVLIFKKQPTIRFLGFSNKPIIRNRLIMKGKSISFLKPIKVVDMHKIKTMPKKNLNYFQATLKYKHLKAFGDADHDGILNAFDCKPFDKKRHGPILNPGIAMAKPIAISPEQIMARRAALAAQQEALANNQDMASQEPAIENFNQIRNKSFQTDPAFRPGSYDEDNYADLDRGAEFAGAAAPTPIRGFAPGQSGVKFG